MKFRIVGFIAVLTLAAAALAQDAGNGVVNPFGTEEMLYAVLILPVVQWIKQRFGWSGIRVQVLSVVVGVVLTVTAQLVGYFDYGGIYQALVFGALAGLVGSGIKDLAKSIVGAARPS